MNENLHAGKPASLHRKGLEKAHRQAYQAAHQLISEAIALDPCCFQYRISLCEVCEKWGNPELAARAYLDGIRVKPDWADGYNNLGVVYIRAGNAEKGLACFRKAVEIRPDYVDALNNLGSALKDGGRVDAAIPFYEQAVRLRPDYAGAWSNLGNTYRAMGQMDRAETAFRKALELDPANAAVHRDLANTVDHTTRDKDILEMEHRFKDPGAKPFQRLHLGFGLAKAFADLDDPETAFFYLSRANRIMRESYTYEIQEEARFFKAIKQVFSPEFFRRHPGSGIADPAPVFILGMPRSGTSLVEQILASHSRVHGAGELEYIKRIAENGFVLAQDRRFPESVPDIPLERLRQAGQEYLEAVKGRDPEKAFITDKMPGNFRFIGLIRLLLPRARIIHCTRDPRAVCLSIFRQLFRGDHAYAYDLTELGTYYNLYADLMAHWHRVLPGIILDIRYEDLVREPEAGIRKLLTFFGLDWEDACLAFHRTRRSVATASANQVRRPIYRDSVDAWKRFKPYMGPCFDLLR